MVGKDYFIFNGIKSTDRNLLLKSYSKPILAPPELNVVKAPGALGSYVSSTKGKGDYYIPCRVAALKTEADSSDAIHAGWLGAVEAKLEFWDLPGKHFIATVFEATNAEDFDVWLEAEITFIAKPYLISNTEKVTIGNADILNTGTTDTVGEIELTVTTESKTVQVAYGSEFIKFIRETDFPVGTKFYIDLEKKQAKVGASSAMEYVTFDSDYFKIKPGTTSKLIGTNCTTKLTFHERWAL